MLTNTPIESADLWLPNLPKLENVHPDGHTPFLSIFKAQQTDKPCREMSSAAPLHAGNPIYLS